MRIVAFLSLLAVAGSASALELVTNGDLQAKPLGAGWTQTSPQGPFVGDWGLSTGGAVTTNSAWLGGYANADDVLSQALTAPALTAGGTLAFDLTRFTADDPGFDFLSVSLDGATLATIDLGGSATAYSFSRQTFALPTSFGPGAHTLAFRGTTNGSFDSSAFLDNVSLDAKMGTVPEPATLAALGLGAAALLRRRGRSR